MGVRLLPLLSIYIPAKSELTATMQSITRSMFFLQYNHKYKNISQYLVWLQISSAVLTEEEKTTTSKEFEISRPYANAGI